MAIIRNLFEIKGAKRDLEFTSFEEVIVKKSENHFLEQMIAGLTFTSGFDRPLPLVSNNLADILNSSDFENLEIPDDQRDKIEELRVVTESIDRKIISTGALIAGKKFKIDYLRELNPQQLAAVTTTEIPLLVIAGAGSGKTRVITYKVSYLIENNVDPSSILLLTFTKKAATEMLNRVGKLLADQSILNVLGGTFHSFSNYVLRKYGNLIGIRNNFSIIDTEDAADILDLLKTELNFSGRKKGPPFPRKGKIQTILSKAKNLELSIPQVVRTYFDENSEYIKELEQMALAFDIYKKASNLMDYDDLMVVLRDNLKHNLQLRVALQKSIKYILVDEYQDTNNTQREIVELIAGDRGRITVVGDDSQSIYAFRGANLENILRFPQNFPDCGVVKIEQNYRSEQGILNFTNDIILHAKIGFKKKLFSQRFTGKKPIIKRFPDGITEAEYIVDRVLEIRNNNLDFCDFSILTRASWHSNYIQAELIKRKIPFVVVGGIKFSERRHIKDIVAFIKIVINPIDAIAWHRILQLIEGVGKVRAREIVQLIHQRSGVIDFSDFAERKYYPQIKKLQELFNQIIDNGLHLFQIIECVFEFYKPILQQIEDDFEVRLKDLDVFRIIAEKYDDIEKFIADFTLAPPSNRYQDQTIPMTDTESKPLVVSTIHSAKGLEWHTVFVPFALDGLFPSSRSVGTLQEIEEERRLFYVAASRAKENLFITMPSYVSSWDAVFTKPSRFIYEISKDYYLTD